MKVILYTTHCPKCEILKKKLDAKRIAYTENDNIEEMVDLGICTVPVLRFDDELLPYADAVKWVNGQECANEN